MTAKEIQITFYPKQSFLDRKIWKTQKDDICIYLNKVT